MTRHLTDEEIATLVAGENVPDHVRTHLEACVSCRRELEALEDLVAGGRDRLSGDEPDWAAQHERIVEALATPPAEVVPLRRPTAWRPLLAAAAALVMAAGVWLGLRGQRNAPAPTAAVSVEQVLADVEATLSDTSVPGFEALEGLVPGPDELEGLVSNPASQESGQMGG